MIRDQIIKGNLDEFVNQFNFTDKTEDVAFEHFINYVLLSRINSKIFEDDDYIEKINVDNGKNFGIDGIALLINNTFVFNEDNIEKYVKSSEHYASLNLNFVFTQAKTTAGFDTGEVLKFVTAVKDFFKESLPPAYGNDIKKFWELKNKLLSYETLQCVDKNISPALNLYYATTGNPSDDELLIGIVKNQKKDMLRDNPIFKDINIYLIDRNHLIKYYQEIKNQVEQRVIFKEKVDLGTIKGVGKAFLGFISANEYLRLITDEDNFRQNLFYENVRDFKGEDNKVNQEIAETIKTELLNDKFVLMNNGITIVAKSVDTNFQGGEIKIINYQIVNGCQTSNVLFLNRALIKPNSSILIPLKLIECQDNDITSEITKATNNQNPVPEEAFIALEEFPKNLQRFFDSKSKTAPNRIYYERRSREYDFIKPPVNQSQIFHLHKLIRALVCMFIEQPHSCHRYPGELYKQTKSKVFGVEQKMFTKNQSPFPYYTSCYAWFIVEQMFNKKEIDLSLKQFKFHILMLLRLKITNETLNNFENIKSIEVYCNKILDILYDETKYKPLVKAVCAKLNEAIKAKNSHVDYLVRLSDFTEYIKKIE